MMPHQIVKNFQNSTVLPWTKSMFDTYNGTFITNIVGDDYLFTCHPQNVKHILADQFSNFSTSEERKHLFKHFSNRGILTLDGPAWVASREQLRRQFSHYRSIMDLDMYERHASQFIARIPGDGSTIDLQEMFGMLALDALTEFVMGTSVASLSGEQSEELKTLSAAIRYIKSTIARKGFFGPMHWAVGRGEFKKQCDAVRNYVQRAALKTLKDREIKGDAFLEDESGYCFLRSLAVGEQDCDVLRDQVADIVLAGVDTLTSLLSATFWLLARDERVLDILRAKVRDTCGSDRPTYDQIKGLPYLRWVINEGIDDFPSQLVSRN
jgi:cytochrome P450